MARSRRFETDEKKHEDESPSHKKRREERHKLDTAKFLDIDELEDDEFEVFEPIKRKGGRGK